MKIKNRKSSYRKCSKLSAGLETHSEVVVVHVSQAILDQALGASRTAETDFQASRAVTQATRDSLGLVKQEAIVWATKARDALKPFLGSNGWNVAYAAAGWVNQSLAIPQSVEGLLELLPVLTGYFTRNPKHQNTEAKVTAVLGQDIFDRLQAANQALSAAEVAQRTRRDAREAADAVLEEKAGTLLKELDTALKPTDPRWLDFIGDIPGDPQRPEGVENLRVTTGLPGELNVEWDGGLRTERYQVEILVAGRDTEFNRVATVKDENTTLSALPAGVVVQVRVLGANKVGEGPASAAVTATVPALADAA